MKLEYYSVEKLKEDILKILSKYLDLSQYKVFFFGSRVKGNADERANIALVLKVQKFHLISNLKLKKN